MKFVVFHHIMKLSAHNDSNRVQVPFAAN